MDHPSVLLAPPAPLREWQPSLPPGDLRGIRLHWTAGDYSTVFPAYHFCLAGAQDVIVHHTHDLRANMRDVAGLPEAPYAAHTRGRNSYTIGLSVCAMRDATPSNFGAFPITPAQIAALCFVAAELARFYAIDVAQIGTHAEAALADGYFGAGDDEVRWDIARISPSPEPLRPEEARAAGDLFRTRIAALK